MKRLGDEGKFGVGTFFTLFLGWLIASAALYMIVSRVSVPAWAPLVIAGLGCACYGFLGAYMDTRFKEQFMTTMIVVGGIPIGRAAVEASFVSGRNPWVGASGSVGGVFCVVLGVVAYCWLMKDFQFLRSLGPRRR